MGKNTRKPAPPRKPKNIPLPRSSPILLNIAKHKLIRKTPSPTSGELHSKRVASLIN